jgi:hypothetical protein
MDNDLLAEKYNLSLPQRIREYLQQARGISPRIIDQELLGWNGWRITIPVRNREGKVTYFKLAKDPQDRSDGPKMLGTSGALAELYPWQQVLEQPPYIVICEGEFDRLVLSSWGIRAVTSTCGAGTFKTEWVEYFLPITNVYICFDNDQAGESGMERIAKLLPHSKIIRLPQEVGPGGDVSDYFVKLRKNLKDFFQLMAEAKPARDEYSLQVPEESHVRNPLLGVWGHVARIKSLVPAEYVIGRYIPLKKSGKHYIGKCPFHPDKNPSFVVFQDSQNWFCFGCRAYGDVIDFVQRFENTNFKQALQAIQQLAA